jgi:hypothetical protein
LSGIAILKKSEQVVYTIMRMKRPADLVGIFVFGHADNAEPLSPTLPELDDGNADENRVQTDLGDVAVEVEVADTSNEHMEAQPEIPRHTEPEIIQNEAPTRFRPGIFSCACEPCEPAQGDPALVSALPSDQVLTVDSELRAKLDAATAKIASMEAELAALRAKNARSQVLQSADVEQ